MFVRHHFGIFSIGREEPDLEITKSVRLECCMEYGVKVAYLAEYSG